MTSTTRRGALDTAADSNGIREDEHSALTLELRGEPRRFVMADRTDFRLSLVATNRSDATIDPGFDRTRLFVDGEESVAWRLAVGNGKRDAQWSALPPGATFCKTWSALGESLFKQPGPCMLVLRLDDVECTPVPVDVLADRDSALD